MRLSTDADRDDRRSAEVLDAAIAAGVDLLGRSIDIRACRHPPGLPALALALARTHDLDLARSVHVGRNAADRGFAARAGMLYRESI